MALKPLNSVAGFSVGEVPSTIINSDGNVAANNITATGVTDLGPIGNVKISGGSSNQVIQTDGAGNLSFVSISTSSISNGSSNVSISTVNGNITLSVGGTANVAVVTTTGIEVQGNVVANGNVSVNNYPVTPSTKDLIVAPATQVTRFYSSANPYSTGAYDLGNSLARWGNLYITDANISNTAVIGNVRTDNLLHANGDPWDFQQPAGANTQLQYNDGAGGFGASANLTFDYSTQVLKVTGNANITNTALVGNLRTDNLLHANGDPWDFQQPAGSNTQIQYNDGAGGFGASANFTFDYSANVLTVDGNANITNTLKVNQTQLTSVLTQQVLYSNGSSFLVGNANFTFNESTNLLTVTGDANITGDINTSNVYISTIGSGQVAIAYTDGQLVGGVDLVWDFSNAKLVTTSISANGNITANNITANNTANVSNLNVSNTVTSSLIPNANATYNLGNSSNQWDNIYANTIYANISGNIVSPGSDTQILFNDGGEVAAYANFTYDKTANGGGGQLDVGNGAGGEIVTDSLITSYANVNGELIVTGNANVTGNVNSANVNTGNVTATGSISTTGSGGDITMSGGDITGVNDIQANTATFQNDLTVNGSIEGTSANYSSTVTVNNLTVNLELSGNTANFDGNIAAANFIGPLANGTSNVLVYTDSDVTISTNGTANIAKFTGNTLQVVGDIQSTAGNLQANGNVIANSFLNSANANVTGEAQLGSVLTANITAPSGNVSISAAGSNNNILLVPTGAGTVDVALHRVTQVSLPTDPNDAATKEYVDNISQGLYIHTAANVLTASNLNATYDNGGVSLTATTITGGKTITFSANHGLALNDNIKFTNSFDGIVSGEEYFVYSVPAANQITIKNGYFGAEITTLTNVSGITEPAVAKGGVGATLTNAGTQAALTIDGILMTVGARVLVSGQSIQAQNGIYEVTTVGTGSTDWVLTRASDGDTYAPKSATNLCAGSYFFISQGTNYAGSSYVLTSPAGEINIGVTNVIFTQFSASGSYTAGSGINITGTVISANVDNETTAISGGNIVVKSSANLTTPNIGDATFSSLTWNTLSNGNVTANNLSISNVANVTGNITTSGNLFVDKTVQANGNISGANFSTTGNVSASGNVIAANITANSTVFASNANVSGTTITNALSVNNAITGNTANFSGNIVANNIQSNLEFVGNTANFSGNVIVPNLTVNLELSGNTANFSGAILGNSIGLEANLVIANVANGGVAGAGVFTDNLYYSNGAPWDLQEAAGSNTQIQYNDGSGNFGASANLTFDYAAQQLNINGKANVATSVIVGETAVAWGTVTTTATTANQTIASISTTGVTGIEFLVKGVESAGSKYSMATVQAVTDGTSVDYSTFGTVNLGGYTGSLAVNISGGYVRLQVTPASGNSTVWTTQVRTI